MRGDVDGGVGGCGDGGGGDGGGGDIIMEDGAEVTAAPFHAPVACSRTCMNMDMAQFAGFLQQSVPAPSVAATAVRRKTGGRAEQAERNKSNWASGEWVSDHI